MNIIVCIKQVPGTNRVEVDPVTGVLQRDGVESKLNPYDLFALEEAFKLAEATGGTVKTLSMGPPQTEQALLETLWMGAQEGALLSDKKFGGADVAATSYALSLGVSRLGKYDIILCGKQTTDGDTAQVGPELAERLGIEHVANVTRILAATDTDITVVADMGDAFVTLCVPLPCLLTVDKDANTPRLPSYKLKKRTDGETQIRVFSAADFPEADEGRLGLAGSPTQVERIFPPERNADKTRLTGTAAELTDTLYALLTDQKFV